MKFNFDIYNYDFIELWPCLYIYMFSKATVMLEARTDQ